MAITRTAMIDDDGSGTTGTILNNAWKQELYSQVDGLVTNGTWAPVDASGAGLVLTVANARYSKHDKVVRIWCHLTYPATSNGAVALISGLPFVGVPFFHGFYQSYGPPTLFHMNPSATGFALMNPTSLGQHSNATLSGAVLIFTGIYQTP